MKISYTVVTIFADGSQAVNNGLLRPEEVVQHIATRIKARSASNLIGFVVVDAYTNVTHYDCDGERTVNQLGEGGLNCPLDKRYIVDGR